MHNNIFLITFLYELVLLFLTHFQWLVDLLLKNFDFLTADTMIVSQQDGTVAVIDTRTSKWVYEIIQSITSGWVLSLIQDLINWNIKFNRYCIFPDENTYKNVTQPLLVQ
jgi:hypothetical protein